MIEDGLARAIPRQTPASSADGRLTSERMWYLSCFATGRRGTQARPRVDRPRRVAAQHRAHDGDSRNSVASTWTEGGHRVDSTDVIRLDAQLASVVVACEPADL